MKSSTQEQELKVQLQSVQEQAQKQIQEVSSTLHSTSAKLEEKEKEVIELKLKLEQELSALQQQLLNRNKELQVAREVCNYYMHVWPCFSRKTNSSHYHILVINHVTSNCMYYYFVHVEEGEISL